MKVVSLAPVGMNCVVFISQNHYLIVSYDEKSRELSIELHASHGSRRAGVKLRGHEGDCLDQGPARPTSLWHTTAQLASGGGGGDPVRTVRISEALFS